jgi:hypothetical protein
VTALFPPGGNVVFTSGATEALNLALRGCEPGRAGRPVAVSAIEHSAVLNTALDLPGDTTILPVDRDGLVDPQVRLPEGVGIVSVMQVNNEIGTIQPIAELCARARAEGAARTSSTARRGLARCGCARESNCSRTRPAAGRKAACAPARSARRCVRAWAPRPSSR